MDSRHAASSSRPANSTADRVLRVLSEFRDATSELGVTDVSQATGLDKSVVHRILSTLADHHFLERNDVTRKYMVGLRAWEVGRRFTVSSWVDEAAVPLLAEVVAETGGTGYIGSLDGTEVVYLATVDGAGPIRVHVDVGSRTTVRTTALGRAILAHLAPDAQDAVLDDLDFSADLGDGARGAGSTREELVEELAATRLRGYAINRGESRKGVGAIGVAVSGPRGTPVAAISVGFPLMPQYERLWEILPPELVRVAGAISRRMG